MARSKFSKDNGRYLKMDSGASVHTEYRRINEMT